MSVLIACIFALVYFCPLAHSSTTTKTTCLDGPNLYKFNYLKRRQEAQVHDKLFYPKDFHPCRPVHCYANKEVRGRESRIPNVWSVEDCSHHCCISDQCKCSAFFWREDSQECIIYFNSPDQLRSSLEQSDEGLLCEFKAIPKGYRKTYRSSYLKLYNDKSSWDDANNKCASDGGQLVEDDYGMKHDELRREFKGTYWIGVRELYKGDKHDYGWAYEGLITHSVEPSLRLWDDTVSLDGFPNPCVYMGINGRWNASVCSDRKPFVCEILAATEEKEEMEMSDEYNHDKNHENFSFTHIFMVLIPILSIVFGCCCRYFIKTRHQRNTGSFVPTNSLPNQNQLPTAPAGHGYQPYPPTNIAGTNQNQFQSDNEEGNSNWTTKPYPTPPILPGQPQHVLPGQPPFASPPPLYTVGIEPSNQHVYYTPNYPVQALPHPPPSFQPPTNYDLTDLPPPPAYSTLSAPGENQTFANP